MENSSGLKNYKIYVAIVIALVITIFLFPREGRFKYSYQRGRPWVYQTLLSPIDFPILKTEQELLEEMEEKSSMVVPYFNYDNSVVLSQQGRLMSLQGRDSVDSHILYVIIENLRKFYDVGIAPDMKDGYDGTIVIQKDKRAQEVPLSEVYNLKKVESYMRYNLSASFPQYNIDSIYSLYSVSDYIVPNLIYDQYKTDLFHKRAVDYISPTKGMIYVGQLIVSEGEIVTAEIEQLLDSFKAEYELTYGYTGSPGGLIAGHAIISILILAALVAVLYFTRREVFTKVKEFYFIITMYILLFVFAAFAHGEDGREYLIFIPFSVIAIYLTMFFSRRVVFPVYTVMLLPLLFLSRDGVELFFMNMIGGIIATISFRYFNRGWLQFINSLFIYLGMALTYMSFILAGDGSLSMMDLRESLKIAVNSLLVVASHPFVFLFERIFSLVSQSRLLDLSDTNNKLLRELAEKAPGTFQHSLQVSNLAGEAAREIGADVMLARVGALYHDIGKIRNPQCFVENTPSGFNYHKENNLTPIESAQQIIKHVSDGLEIARKHRLPQVVADFILTHHAKSLTFFFYAEYCNQGGDKENKEPFTYNGELPVSKEQVIVLMADAVEAASRSLKDYSLESISALVEKIISQRLSDSQLTQADISIREIAIVKKIFKARLAQVYHERIAYPDIKK